MAKMTPTRKLGTRLPRAMTVEPPPDVQAEYDRLVAEANPVPFVVGGPEDPLEGITTRTPPGGP